MTAAHLEFSAIGTDWRISSNPALSTVTRARIRCIVDEFDQTYSRFRPDSDVSRLAQTAGTQEFPDTAVRLLSFYRTLYLVTDGLFSPLVGHALEHLGYDAHYSLRRRPGELAVPRWEDVLTVDGSVVTTSEPVLLDFGAAGKGYLVDLLAAELSESGYHDYLIDGSGDLVHRGPQACRIGLEHPDDPTKVIGVANVGDGALCGSAVNRRSWGQGLHHVIDPRTAEPSDGVLATWVLARDAMVADGLATALFFVDPAVLAGHFEFSYVRMPATGGLEYSTNFDGELFT